jgi:hypothetical protein
MQGPIFSPQLDNRTEVRAWLSTLSETERRGLRDDITHRFKEFPRAEVEPLPVEPTEPGLDHVALDELREVIAAVADGILPRWKARAFREWLARKNPTQIARELGKSRASVRAALDGQMHRGEPGAIHALAIALAHDQEFISMATKKVKAPDAPKTDRWFRGISRKPELFAAWSFLLILDDMADARREVPLQDLLAVVPRAIITPLLAQLKAHGMAASDGRTVRIARTPIDMEQTR